MSAHAQLVSWLDDLHRRAGRPSTRTIGGAAGVSHTTVHDMLTGQRLPAWPRLAAVAQVLGGDLEEAAKLWELAAEGRSGRRGRQVVIIPDEEAEAIAVAVAVLAHLSPAAQARVMAFLAERFPETEGIL